MQAQVVSYPARFAPRREPESASTQGLAGIDRITNAIVWLSYCGLVSAGVTVLGW